MKTHPGSITRCNTDGARLRGLNDDDDDDTQHDDDDAANAAVPTTQPKT
jgi:hypothetical protein